MKIKKLARKIKNLFAKKPPVIPVAGKNYNKDELGIGATFHIPDLPFKQNPKEE